MHPIQAARVQTLTVRRRRQSSRMPQDLEFPLRAVFGKKSFRYFTIISSFKAMTSFITLARFPT